MVYKHMRQTETYVRLLFLGGYAYDCLPIIALSSQRCFIVAQFCGLMYYSCNPQVTVNTSLYQSQALGARSLSV